MGAEALLVLPACTAAPSGPPIPSPSQPLAVCLPTHLQISLSPPTQPLPQIVAALNNQTAVLQQIVAGQLQLAAGQAQHAAQLAQLAQLTATTHAQRAAGMGSMAQRLQHAAVQSIWQARTGQLRRAPAAAVPAQAAYAELVAGSWGAAVIADAAVAPTTQQRRVAAFQEFAAWYTTRLVVLGTRRAPACALPEELVVYTSR